ncbi:MAG: patatin family protein [Leptotrichiaceae bacterium]|mgnify:CR=1 FL=1|nr:patatin family protein [Leptotrichiaceae bacterium]MBP6281590.1 patatin family protein [Leptotrichiaceae bacterium]MBP7100736.1 patatin family protein [Leptotrichiaceae bacterium]MBP7725182.1 patatin family protein [Leptotrichiaceae bacterium]MBP9629135.1 patatin family protein [Leptotrichiaceae bacterium]
MEKNKVDKTGLVLEGGGMRGIFTAGVLDLFLENNVIVDNCVAVSAGACLGASYMSKQYKRGFNAIADHINKKEYASFYNLITTGDFFDVDYSYRRVVEEFNPFDNEEYIKNPTIFQTVITNVKTGKAEYPHIRDAVKELIYIRASASLPFLSRMVEINGEKYLDGGVSDPIPLKKAIENGNKKIILILTRDKKYRKKQSKLSKISLILYKKYPKFVELMNTRYERYNETLEYIYELEKKGEVFIIQPESSLDLGRIEKNRKKLEIVYQMGYEKAKEEYKNLIEYLKK